LFGGDFRLFLGELEEENLNKMMEKRFWTGEGERKIEFIFKLATKKSFLQRRKNVIFRFLKKSRRTKLSCFAMKLKEINFLKSFSFLQAKKISIIILKKKRRNESFYLIRPSHYCCKIANLSDHLSISIK